MGKATKAQAPSSNVVVFMALLPVASESRVCGFPPFYVNQDSGRTFRAVCPADEDLPPKSTVHDYIELWNWDDTLERIHHALYVAMREEEGREASPTVAIIELQSAKGAQKGGLGLILRATTRHECASKARVTYGGRFHPYSCRLIWKLTSGSAGVTWPGRSLVTKVALGIPDGKRGGQHEASCFISTEVDPGDDADIVIGKAVAGILAATPFDDCSTSSTPTGVHLSTRPG